MANSNSVGDDMSRKVLVSKQIVLTRTVGGGAIELNVITHSQKLCQEFVVKSPKFSVRRWLMWTIILYTIGCYLQLHAQDLKLMIYVVAVLFLLLLIKLHFKVKRESLLVMASIGVQLTTTFASGRTIYMFYDIAHVSDIVINEAVTMHRVIYYLAILLNQCPKAKDAITRLVPLYTHSWPGLKCLLHIRSEIVQLLKSSKQQNERTLSSADSNLKQ